MPHYTCANCKVRHRVPGAPAELVGDLCPECGSLLEPTAELEGLVGFRAIAHPDDAAGVVQTPPHQRIAARVDGFIARRAERLEREREALDAERWPSDDPIAASAALPVGQRFR